MSERAGRRRTFPPPSTPRPIVRDERFRGSAMEVSFRGELRPDQKTATTALLKHDTGVLAATTAFGKTVVAASLVARRGVNTLILVHRRQLLDQWVDRLGTFHACLRSPSAASAADETRRPASSMWRSSRAWCARGSWTIAWRTTVT